MVLEAIIANKNETSEVYDFKVEQKWGTPPHDITIQIWPK